MLTLKLWRTLNTPLKYPQAVKRLLPQQMPSRGLTIEPMVSLVVLCACATFPFLGIPMILHLSVVRLALHVTHTIAKLYELGRRDLIAVTPIGEMALLFEVCRAYYRPDVSATASSESGDFWRTIIPLAVIVGLVIVPVVLLNFPSTEQVIFPIVVMFGSPVLVVGTVIWEYRQAFVLATLIALLAAQAGERTMARVWMLGSYFALQLSLYVILMLTIGTLTALQTTLDGIWVLLASVGIALGVLFGAREAVIWVLWRRLRTATTAD